MKLPRRAVLDLFATTENDVHWWDPPVVPQFAGPADLANLLKSYRQVIAQLRLETGRSMDTQGDISDASLESLLAYAYRASFLSDEGRPVLARFFVLHRPTVNERDESRCSRFLLSMFQAWEQERDLQTNVYRFAQPRLLDDPKIVAKLAPTLVTDDTVLLVGEIDAKPMLIGIGLLNHSDWERQILKMPRSGNGMSGLLVEILGPGHLRVSEGMNQYTLRENGLVVHERVWSLAPVRNWLFHLSQLLIAKAQENGEWDEEDKQHFGIYTLSDDWPQTDVLITWSRVLREALRLRHGGAFVIVPDVDQAPIKIRFPTVPFHLGDEIIKTWQAIRCIWRRKPDDDVLRLVANKQCATHRLLTTSRSLGALSATDGCVVLDQKLVLHGFGGSIETKEDSHKPKKLVHLQEPGEISSQQLLASLGERHKSAYHLCKVVPQAIAFVLSQDGDLRVFSSVDDSVQFADRLYP